MYFNVLKHAFSYIGNNTHTNRIKTEFTQLITFITLLATYKLIPTKEWSEEGMKSEFKTKISPWRWSWSGIIIILNLLS